MTTRATPVPVPVPRTAAGPTEVTAAVDIGGTKIAGALVRPDGTMTAATRRPTPAGADAETVMAAVAEVVADLAADPLWERVRACGIGSAGPVDTARGTVSPVNITAWRDFPVLDRTRELLAGHGAPVPAVLAGDGVAVAAAEHWLGAARGHSDALCMVVSTGVGGGLILNDRLHTGPTGNAGHIGHISVAYDGDPCACGGHGCVESLASGTAIARWARDQGWTGPDPTAAGVAEAARAGDPVALAAFDRAGRALAAAIAGTATLVEVDIAVIGGGVAAAGEVLFGPVREHLARYAVLSFARDVRVVPAALGSAAGLIGAAAATTHLLEPTA
ncbi:ROK family protein [Streptomyces sp. NPDC097619]|uniref:ROK family protein n=1 Tax=Streptomyces sp. NPDC097619 TaxID=3157228 RepID=UPI003334A57D